MFFKRKLKSEIQIWLKNGIIEPENASRLLRFYNIKENANNFSVINILGYFFLGLSLLIFIGHNWEQIPPIVRVLGLIGLTLGVHIFAFLKLKNQNNSNLFFLANFIYGISIMLIAQAYHLSGEIADALFWWAFGSFFVAVFVHNIWVDLQAFFLAILWAYTKWDSTVDYPAFFWVFLLLCGVMLYKRQNNVLLYLFMISIYLFYPYTLIHFFYYQPYVQSVEEANKSFIFMLVIMPIFGYFMYLLSFKIKGFYAEILRNFSFKAIFILSIFWLLQDFQSETIELFNERGNYNFYLFFSFLFMPIFALNLWLNIKKYYIISIILLAFIILVVKFDKEYIFYLSFIINVILFAIYAFLTYEGITKSSFLHYFSGISGLLIFAIIRYISLIKDYLSASLLFLFCAVILLYAAKYFKKLQLEKSEKL